MEEIWDLALSFRSQNSYLERAYSMCAWRSKSERRGISPTLRGPIIARVLELIDHADVHLEIAYMFKYPVQKTPGNPKTWEIRQSGVYHKQELGLQANTWLLIFPNRESFSPTKIADTMTKSRHPLDAHIEYHFAHLRQWRWYMADLEKEFEKAVSGAEPYLLNKYLPRVDT